MRVKSLAAVAGLSVVTALVLGPAVADASRGSVEPRIVTPVEEPVEDTPAVPVEEAPAPVEETPTAPEVVEEDPAPLVVEEAPAEPVAKKRAAPVPAASPAAPVADEPPVVEPAPVVIIEPKKAPAPAPDHGKDHEKKDHAKDPCHMDSYEPRDVDSLDGGEAARAEKVDRNGNGTVCRKDIPGNGRGNTGQGSNIKDDQVR